MLITDTFKYIKKSVPEKEKHQLHSRHGPLLLTKFMDATVTCSFPRISILHPCSPGQDLWILCFPQEKKKNNLCHFMCATCLYRYVHVRMKTYMHKQRPHINSICLSLSLSISLYIMFWNKVSHETGNSSVWLPRLAEQWMTEICLSVPSWCWHYKSLTPWQPLHEC